MGVGGTVGMYGWSNPGWYVGAAGHIGIEYDFWFPFQLSLDWRPNIGVCGVGGDVAFNTWGSIAVSLWVFATSSNPQNCFCRTA